MTHNYPSGLPLSTFESRPLTTGWHEIEVSLVNVRARFEDGRLHWSTTRDKVLAAENDLSVEDALNEELKRKEGERDDE